MTNTQGLLPTPAMIEAGCSALRACRLHQTGDEKLVAEIWRAMSEITRPVANPSDDKELVEKVAAAIGEVERSQCGGYKYESDDPALNPWLTDKHRTFARAAIEAMPPPSREAVLREAAIEAGHAAYSRGYRDGYVDAHVTDETGWPDDDGAALLRRVDSTSMADGWQNHIDTFASALGQSHIRGGSTDGGRDGE